MSGVAIVRYLLANNANLVAAVPASRIKAGVLPLDIALPAISVSEVSGEEHNNVAMDFDTTLITSRAEVLVKATTYPSKKSILELVRKALPNTSGTVHGFVVDSIIPEATGPDDDDADLTIYTQGKKFAVRFRV